MTLSPFGTDTNIPYGVTFVTKVVIFCPVLSPFISFQSLPDLAHDFEKNNLAVALSTSKTIALILLPIMF